MSSLQRVLLDTKSYKIKNINLVHVFMKKNSYRIKILYSDHEFQIQSNLCKVENLVYDEKDHLTNIEVSFDVGKHFNFYKFVGTFNNHLLKYITSFSQKKDLIPEKEVLGNFNRPFHEERNKVILKFKVNNETKIFNHDKKEIYHSEIKKKDRVVLLFYTKGLFIDKHSINYAWTAKQILKVN